MKMQKIEGIARFPIFAAIQGSEEESEGKIDGAWRHQYSCPYRNSFEILKVSGLQQKYFS